MANDEVRGHAGDLDVVRCEEVVGPVSSRMKMSPVEWFEPGFGLSRLRPESGSSPMDLGLAIGSSAARR